MTVTDTAKFRLASEILAVLALVTVLRLGLLSALLAGLLIFLTVQTIVPLLRRMGITRGLGHTIALMIPALIIGVILAYGIVEFIAFVTGPDSLTALLQRVADIVGAAHRYLPDWAQAYVPASIDDFQDAMAEWLREHAGQLSTLGQTVGRVMFHIVIGLTIGGMLAVRVSNQAMGPLSRELEARATNLAAAFRSIVFSQIRISALNTALTAVYLVAALPLFGISLPLVKTMVAVTFMAGLIPILGNLISSSIIVIVSLSVAPMVAVASLVFLVVIHKLEYFMNARIVGTEINARAWELLTALLVMEAAFGIPGLIAAPIYYAYFKRELIARGLI